MIVKTFFTALGFMIGCLVLSEGPLMAFLCLATLVIAIGAILLIEPRWVIGLTVAGFVCGIVVGPAGTLFGIGTALCCGFTAVLTNFSWKQDGQDA